MLYQSSSLRSQRKDGPVYPTTIAFLKLLDETGDVKRCDEELNTWPKQLPEYCMFGEEVGPGNSADPLVILHRLLLHTVYFATISTLHKLQLFDIACKYGKR